VEQVGLLLARGLIGGVMVVAFALVAEVLKPKMFSGLFSAAPSIAIGSLLVTSFAQKPTLAAQDASGMVAGAFGMVACTLVAAYAVQRLGAIAGSAAAWLAWGIAATVMFVALFR
jgi:uncharacterized membrane protein (GlpM family)